MTSKEFKQMLSDGKRRSQQYIIGWPDQGLCTVNGIRADKYCIKHFGADMTLYIDEKEEKLTFEMYVPTEDGKSYESHSMPFTKEYMVFLQRMVPNLNQLIGLVMAIDKSSGPIEECQLEGEIEIKDLGNFKVLPLAPEKVDKETVKVLKTF